MKVKCFESNTGIGGVWINNSYPGARVDSEAPFYQLNIPEVWQSWTFSERFPSGSELRSYFAHVDRIPNLSKDICFQATVCEAVWDSGNHMWSVKTKEGHEAVARYVVACTGTLYSTYVSLQPHQMGSKTDHVDTGLPGNR
jgi:cation diffusion facilitator CzcD-associated flavoprotein CzcO